MAAGNKVHCQCANKTQGQIKSSLYCLGVGSPLVNPHGHCNGAYTKDGYAFGDAAVGSVYSVN
jgi:hypothetical protein